jgi:hypothetical protein
MNKFHLIIPVILVCAFSCTKNDKNQPHELNITYSAIEKSNRINDTSSINDVNFVIFPEMVIYPNPSSGVINCRLSGMNITDFQLSNDKGDFKKFDNLQSENYLIDLSEEKAGVYYCEALIDNIVFRVQFIKL